MSWSDIERRCSATFQRVFGETFIYQQAGGAPFEITAIRLSRAPEQAEDYGAFEGIQIVGSDFGIPPQIGDFVYWGEVAYIVSAIRDINPSAGTKTLVLNRRRPL